MHTRYSRDGLITAEELVFYAKKRRLDGVAVTDHDSVEGLREFCHLEGLLVVPGVEVETRQGHVLAIGVDTAVEAGLSFFETVGLIHDLGGLAVVAHPTAFFKGASGDVFDQGFDAMEVVNSSAMPFSFSVRRNRGLAARFGLPQTGGSDAHYGPEVGLGYTVVDVDGEADVDEVVGAIRRGGVEAFGRAVPLGVRLKREFLCAKKRWFGRV